MQASRPETASSSAPEIVRGVRVHGNATLSDADVLKLANVAVGATVDAETISAIEKRLKDSKLFENVEVRKRFASLDNPRDIVIVLVVHERPGVTAADVAPNPAAAPFKRLKNHAMFLPILSYADGYGFTYGARVSTVDWLGAGERLSVPLTWGGTKRAAFEFERPFKRGPLSRITSSVGVRRVENPRFDIDDERVEYRAGAERRLANYVHLGVAGSRSRVDFGDLGGTQWTFGTVAALDTRADPGFPRNAIYVGGEWTSLHLPDSYTINRFSADARGYLGLLGQLVAAGRVQYFTADATLPAYERYLLGGASTLRGFRAGAFDGDRMLVTTAELRAPLTSIISGVKLGVIGFGDFAKVADAGTTLDGSPWRRGAGAGLFLDASILRVNVDVAHGFDGGGMRVHLASGFSF